MTPPARSDLVQRLCAAVAILFGIVTLIQGGRVLGGADPGYVVFRPLLLFNVAMGAVYIAAGIVIWRALASGRKFAGAIFLLNLLVLAGIALLWQGGGAVATQSLGAMSFRTILWLALFLVLGWRLRRGAAG
ncbi:MAG TPA: hypothetical protein PKC23_09870 [Candidatus Desulfobacillus sp.]|nr:hypothetical protein [Candidatus Desulfobacillus sp.]